MPGLTCGMRTRGKSSPTARFAAQLTKTTRLEAAGRGPCKSVLYCNIVQRCADLGEHLARNHPGDGARSHCEEHDEAERGGDEKPARTRVAGIVLLF